MSSVNKVILLGHLGQDPEVRYTPGGDAVATLRLATSSSWKDKQTGEKQERTEWHSVVCWKRLAEIAGEYLRKGSQVYIEGELQTRKWQDKEGKDRYTTEVRAANLQMLGKPSGESKPTTKPSGGAPARGHNPKHEGDESDDIPFITNGGEF